ncbi:sigma 54-interacting transcriptional regulator [Alkalihalobacillus oceani]|uniref:Sigma 54-interacting transcriptional regulator n=1 Tax=Halalkalibacter oceani TaxID=1653776 RepID=A0A9X2DT83_9BACI|nr:sigma 54-interacting transcriptional regulator [Halalkalibacter oceani]MCM3715725.1 sigma 54-interacting transcriptional regulator [Halalkalibacter oceani]
MKWKELDLDFPLGVLVVDCKGTILFANKFAQIRLMKVENPSMLTIQHLLPTSNIIRVIKNGRHEVNQLELDDSYYLLEFPLEKGDRGVIILVPENVFQNIIEKSPAYTSLLQETESIMNLSGELVTITDHNGIVLRVNNTCEKIMGIKEYDFVGRSVLDLQKSGVVNLSSTAKVLETNQKVTLQQVTKSGRRLLVNGYPIFHNDGELSKVINISKDITEIGDLKAKLEETNRTLTYYQEELLKLQHKGNDLIFKSKSMEEVYGLASRIANVDATVLIQGETGVGKEVLARTIHNLSSRRDKPFVKVNCGAIPETLIESELFGYAKGTFTGGNSNGKVGLVQAANHGTLFFDEIGELPFNLQAKLLQVLQEKQFTPLGTTKNINVDVRFITATNRKLEEMVKEGTFREDLYYRLFVIPITIPPLAERKQDIPFLLNHFIERYNQKYKQAKSFDKDVIEFFMELDWKGNVRELQNTVERLVVTVPENRIQIHHLPENLAGEKPMRFSTRNLNLKSAMDEYEKSLIIEALKSSSTLKEASEKLGIDPSTIGRKIKKHSIEIAKLQHIL